MAKKSKSHCRKPMSKTALKKCTARTIANKIGVPLVTKTGKTRTKKTLLNMAGKKSQKKLKRRLARK
jgi:hypothetical protein